MNHTSVLLDHIRQLSTPLEPEPTETSARLTPLLRVKAVLFDVYGTLFISGSGDISTVSALRNHAALTAALAAAGFTGELESAGVTGSQAFLQGIAQTHETARAQGITYPEVDIRAIWRQVLGDLQQQHILTGEITNERIRRVSIEYEFRVNPVWPMPDARMIITQLHARRIVLGIVSNAQFYTPLMFPALLGISHVAAGFAPELCAWSFELREAKPSHAIFGGVLQQLALTHGILPAETLYVGNDLLNDIWPAAQHGLKTALFAGDRRSLRWRPHDPRCLALSPDVILTQLSQVCDVIS